MRRLIRHKLSDALASQCLIATSSSFSDKRLICKECMMKQKETYEKDLTFHFHNEKSFVILVCGGNNILVITKIVIENDFMSTYVSLYDLYIYFFMYNINL